MKTLLNKLPWYAWVGVAFLGYQIWCEMQKSKPPAVASGQLGQGASMGLDTKLPTWESPPFINPYNRLAVYQ